MALFRLFRPCRGVARNVQRAPGGHHHHISHCKRQLSTCQVPLGRSVGDPQNPCESVPTAVRPATGTSATNANRNVVLSTDLLLLAFLSLLEEYSLGPAKTYKMGLS